MSVLRSSLLLACLVVLAGSGNCVGTAAGADRPVLRIGAAPPGFALKDLGGAERRYPVETAGIPTVIHFWNTSCNFCLEEMPAIDTLYRSYAKKGLKVMAVNVGDTREAAKTFVTTTGVSYPVLLDRDRSVAVSFGITGLPATFFIDRHGLVKHKVLGAADRATLAKYLGNLF